MNLSRTNLCAAACSARADRIGDGNLPKSIRTENGLSRDPNVAFWDFNAFVLPGLATPRIGNAGRGILRGPGRNNWDLGIFKQFQITESKRVEFRYEMFNALNHANFLAPSSSLESQSVFGRITGTEAPRISQFVLKVVF